MGKTVRKEHLNGGEKAKRIRELERRKKNNNGRDYPRRPDRQTVLPDGKCDVIVYIPGYGETRSVAVGCENGQRFGESCMALQLRQQHPVESLYEVKYIQKVDGYEVVPRTSSIMPCARILELLSEK